MSEITKVFPDGFFADTDNISKVNEEQARVIAEYVETMNKYGKVYRTIKEHFGEDAKFSIRNAKPDTPAERYLMEEFGILHMKLREIESTGFDPKRGAEFIEAVIKQGMKSKAFRGGV